jgi:hypothetical protein
VFLLPSQQRGRNSIAILVDSPARVTGGGVIVGEL